jgi:hypothetical protein
MAHIAYFNKEGDLVPSVTTVLKILNKPALINWANYMGFKRRRVDDVLETSAFIGTKVHYLIGCELMQYYPIITYGNKYCKKIIQHMYYNYLIWRVNHYDIKPIFMEKSFSSKTFGGTADFYGYVNGKLTLMDFKTSKKMYMSMFIQLSGYILLIESEGYIIEQVMILLVNEKGVEEKIMSREDMEEYIGIFKILVFLYHKHNYVSNKGDWGESF